jgi:hypothetical protein
MKHLTNNPAIISPSIDTWLVGGFMSAVLVLFLVLGSRVPPDLILWNSAVLTVLVNGTHFMASYRLLYISNEQVRRYKTAGIYLPIILIAYAVVALSAVSHDAQQSWMVELLLAVTALYLALHYTGQAWGMMASFAYLEQTPFQPLERSVFRFCLRILAAWHMAWAVSLIANRPEWVATPLTAVMPLLNVAAIATAVVGAALFWRMSKRTGKAVSPRIWLPFFSLHVWYFFLWIYPQSLFWVQIAHALQYLSFPARIEMNRLDAVYDAHQSRREILKYLTVILMSSCVVFGLMPWAMGAGVEGKSAYWAVVASIINIHHYFIDGCVWHIGNPAVRRDLFSHLPREASPKRA